MRPITQYEADDGTLWTTPEQAIVRDMLCERVASVMAELPGVRPDCDGLTFVQHDPGTVIRTRVTLLATPVHATCFLRGREIRTPKGRRIVKYVKSGDGSPFPVETCGGEQWRDDEVQVFP